MEHKENKSAQDDPAWFDALSGKAERGQGARLRRMLREIELTDAARENTAHDWQRLQFALRREKAETKNHSGYKFFALAASVLIVVGTVTMMMSTRDAYIQPHPDETSVMRGSAEQVIFSAVPEIESKQLKAELLRLGVKVVQHGMAGSIELRIPLSHPVKNEVRAVLEARVIPVPDQGDLTVIFIQTTR